MHLWLYSSGGILNQHVDREMMDYLKKPEPKLAFIPSSYDSAEYYYDEFVERYRRQGVKHFEIFHLDRSQKRGNLERLLEMDLIYLSGGNTFYFLAQCRRLGVFRILERFVSRGGILAGHSAGAILLTPVITTASYPEDDRDENDIGIKDWRGADFVSFEIFPHYDHCPYYREVLKGASHDSAHVIYGVPDGGAICLNGPSLTFYGEIWGFFNGEAFPVSGG